MTVPHPSNPRSQSESPAVSVVIPVFNDEAHVSRAIESALAQTLKDIEVIVVDDGSTDGTPQAAREYEDRITYIRKQNGGAGSARNAGIVASVGRYISFLDSDDLFLPAKSALQAAVLDDHPEVGLCYGASQGIDSRDGGIAILNDVSACGPSDRSDTPLPPFFSTPSFLARREILLQVGGYDETIRSGQDTDLRLRLWAAGCKFWGQDELVASWFIRPGSLTSSPVSQFLGHLRALERHFATMGEAAGEAIRNEALAEGVAKLGAGHLRDGQLPEARDAWRRSLECDPGSFGGMRYWSKVLHILNPNYPLTHPRGFEDYSEVYRTIREAIGPLLRDDRKEGAANIRTLAAVKSLLALSLAKTAFAARRGWLARWWFLRALLQCPLCVLSEGRWRLAAKLLLGPRSFPPDTRASEAPRPSDAGSEAPLSG